MNGRKQKQIQQFVFRCWIFLLLLMSVSYNWKTSEIFWSKLSLSLTIRLDPVIAGSLICHWFFKYSAGKEHRFTPDDEWLLWKFNHLKRDISTRDPILKANSCTALILFSQRFQGIQTLQEVQKGFCPCDNLWLHQSFSRQEKKKVYFNSISLTFGHVFCSFSCVYDRSFYWYYILFLLHCINFTYNVSGIIGHTLFF